MDFQTLRIKTDGELGRIILNRPEHGNALNAAMLKEIPMAAAWFNSQTQVRVVIINGEGAFFCPGADIKDLPIKDAAPESGLPWHQRREIGQLGKRMADALTNMHAVTIAQIHGAAVGGGLVIMISCDFRIVANDTKMFIPEVDLGIPLAWGGIPRLVREIGPSRTKELVMTCRHFTPEEAFQMGLINRVCLPDKLEMETLDFARSLLSKPSVPIVITKEHVNAVSEEIASTNSCFSDGDTLLGIVKDPEMMKAATQYIQKLGAKKE